MASFQDLPHEIVQLIGSYLSPASLHNFSLVNSLCCAVSDPGIFQHIHLVLSERKKLIEELHRWDQILHQSPRRASRHIRRLTISCTCYPRGWTDFESWAENESWVCGCYCDCCPDNGVLDDFFYYPAGSTDLTAAKLDRAGQAELEEEDKRWLWHEKFNWRPLTEFIARLPALHELVYFRLNVPPPGLMDVLHDRHPRCRLLILHPALEVLQDNRGRINRYHRQLITSPNLHHAAVDVSKTSHELHAAPDIPPRSLYWLGISNDNVTATCFEALARYILFSRLRCLVLLGDIQNDGIAWLVSNAGIFTSLEALTCDLTTHDDDTDSFEVRQRRDQAGVAVLAAFRPLKRLTLNNLYGRPVYNAALRYHGPTLQQLFLHSTNRKILLHASVKMIDNIRLTCPNLRKLRLSIRRSQGDRHEVEHYRALAKIPKLELLHLYLDPINYSRDPDSPETYDLTRAPIVDDAYIRQSLVNCAVDASLAVSIFKIIAKNPFTGGYSAFKDITVYVRTGSARDISSGNPRYASYFSFFRYSTYKPWKCTRGEGYDEVVVKKIDIEHWSSISEDEIEDLDRDHAGLFRSIWPERRGKNCLEDWYSLPLDVDS
ncbi:TPA_exp: Uncharacterized protein A8136_6997 [Trichophyton benhamiae CBS 112371]|uniref:F-box domain-containing protein n=1 Tax=Arthroderma benhamiae (strain ATCC MYA-4681 / CBS 112371) TaxID=663331 RepID=D4ASL2_ARTBC|nr:uncharacterized protein ARB_07227 [Trichophyton benhamiae CBS 112371]EFE33762.1 hypothetical protein ARB_07227 [Trichophyton benhamiae CBS 112371]DAA76768.1 TPA_exp: Uncharacterized protein A8136_6997 [Trichophyton benhamiae CBS 112371]